MARNKEINDGLYEWNINTGRIEGMVGKVQKKVTKKGKGQPIAEKVEEKVEETDDRPGIGFAGAGVA